MQLWALSCRRCQMPDARAAAAGGRAGPLRLEAASVCRATAAWEARRAAVELLPSRRPTRCVRWLRLSTLVLYAPRYPFDTIKVLEQTGGAKDSCLTLTLTPTLTLTLTLT